MWLDVIDADFVEIVHGNYPWGHPLMDTPQPLRSIEVRSDSGRLAVVLMRELPERQLLEIVAQRIWVDDISWLDPLVAQQLAQTHPGWALRRQTAAAI